MTAPSTVLMMGILGSIGQFVSGLSYGSIKGSGNSSASNNEGCFPNIIEKPVTTDPMLRLGQYYEYAVKYEDKSQVYNNEFVNTFVGDTYLLGTTIPAVHFTQLFRWITLVNGQPQCRYNFIDALSRTEGRDYYNLFDPTFGNAQPQPQVLYLIYEKATDRGFEIQFQCVRENRRTGVCDISGIYVNSRLRPDQMTAAERTAIDAGINEALKPYCLTIKDLQKVLFRSDLSLDATCNQAAPQAFHNLVEGYKAGLPVRTRT